MLSLSYQNILKIQNLDGLIRLEKLQLDNNLIERIENLDHLVNLKWLGSSLSRFILQLHSADFRTGKTDPNHGPVALQQPNREGGAPLRPGEPERVLDRQQQARKLRVDPEHLRQGHPNKKSLSFKCERKPFCDQGGRLQITYDLLYHQPLIPRL